MQVLMSHSKSEVPEINESNEMNENNENVESQFDILKQKS